MFSPLEARTSNILSTHCWHSSRESRAVNKLSRCLHASTLSLKRNIGVKLLVSLVVKPLPQIFNYELIPSPSTNDSFRNNRISSILLKFTLFFEFYVKFRGSFRKNGDFESVFENSAITKVSNEWY